MMSPFAVTLRLVANENAGSTEGTSDKGGDAAAGTTGGAADKSQTSALGGEVGVKPEVKETSLAGGDKGATDEKPVELALKFPEGVDPKTDETIKQFLPIAKELGLKGEGAQKLVDIYIGQRKASEAKALADFDSEQAEWKDLLKSDKEFGGEKYDASVGSMRKLMAKYATPTFRQFLNDTGLGNHPELFRFVFKLSKAMADDTVGDTTSNSVAGKSKALATLLYDAPTPKQES